MDSDPETSGFNSNDELCDDMGGESIGEDGKLHEHDLQPLLSFTETHTAYTTVTSFFHYFMCTA
jgi:hypothetical protein